MKYLIRIIVMPFGLFFKSLDWCMNYFGDTLPDAIDWWIELSLAGEQAKAKEKDAN